MVDRPCLRGLPECGWNLGFNGSSDMRWTDHFSGVFQNVAGI